MRMERKNYLQVYLEEWKNVRKKKHRIKKRKMTKFIEVELESGLGSKLEFDIESELKSDTE